MLELTPIFVLAIIFGFVYGVVQLSIQHKERKLLLEKGADPSIFQQPKTQKVASLRYGLLLIGIALGIFLGSLMAQSSDMPEEAAYFSMVFLFGGIALVVSYFMEKKL
jgi:predicted MFS family arabinose efflux permease